MVCIQCYLPPILFMIYMKLIHPFLAPFIEPAIDKVVGWIWGPEAVQRGCPIRPKNQAQLDKKPSSDDGPSSKQDEAKLIETGDSSSEGTKSKDD